MDAKADYKKDYANLKFEEVGDLANLENVTDYSIKTFPQFGSYGCFTITEIGASKSFIKIKF